MTLWTLAMWDGGHTAAQGAGVKRRGDGCFGASTKGKSVSRYCLCLGPIGPYDLYKGNDPPPSHVPSPTVIWSPPLPTFYQSHPHLADKLPLP